MAVVSNLYVDQGSDYTSIVTVISKSGAPLNLTGFVAKSQMRKSFSSSQSFTFLSEIYDAATGRIKLYLSATQSAAIPAGRWLYDIEITQESTGIKKRVVEGVVTVTPQITQI